MNDWLTHPAVQGAVIPFIAGATAVFALRGRAMALAVAAGLAVTAVLLLGWELEPLTSTRKLVLVSLLAAVAAAGAARLAPGKAGGAHAVLALAVAAGAVWVVQRALAQQPDAEAAAMMALAAGSMLVVLAGLSPAPASSLPNAAVAVLLPWAAAGVAIQGASAVLALLATAAGTAAFAAVLYGFVFRRRQFTRAFATPSTVTAVLVVLASVVIGGVTAWVLLPVAAAPWCARLLNRFHPT